MTGALSGRHALVTGAGGGVGAAIAAAFVAAGARVTLAGRRRAPLAAVAAPLGDAAVVAEGFDVTDGDAIERGLAAARARFGALDIVVNNAGEAPSAPFHRTGPEMWAQVLAVDLTGVYNVTRATLDDLKASACGRLLNVASTAGLKGYAYVSAYCAAKHGVIGLTRALAAELAATDVTVNALCPGFVDTPMTQASIERIMSATGRSREAAQAELTKWNPKRRLVTPQEVADAALWLASPGAGAITGQAIAISDGEVTTG